ncbi:hypothetical protein CLU79DRAFT_886438 [Phycomyces nitens]|nr:hypothetical protein CLU79DRAFT_886438 [Phycomyces nitens]
MYGLPNMCLHCHDPTNINPPQYADYWRGHLSAQPQRCQTLARCIVHLHSTPSKKLCITNPHYNNLHVPSLSFNVISHLVFTFSTFNYLRHLHLSAIQPHIHSNLSCTLHLCITNSFHVNIHFNSTVNHFISTHTFSYNSLYYAKNVHYTKLQTQKQHPFKVLVASTIRNFIKNSVNIRWITYLLHSLFEGVTT